MSYNKFKILFEPIIVVDEDLRVDINNMKLLYKEKEYPMEYTRINKLIDVYGKGNKHLQNLFILKEMPMYISCRSFIEKDTNIGTLHMDLILYNSSLLTFNSGIYNRSVGHMNDIAEIEIHQVLRGKVLVLIVKDGNSYWGIFREREYFEIPANCYHCTYVLEDSTIVANFYGNAFWESDISKKPYIKNRNFYMVHATKNREEYLVQKKDNISFIINELSENDRMYLSYQHISKECMPISARYDLNKSIFELFNEFSF